MNKKGMTLLELMIYIAVAGMLLAPIVMLMHNSSVNMARDAKSTDMKTSGRDILNIMFEDIRNTGYKIDPGNLEVKYEATYLESPDDLDADGKYITTGENSSSFEIATDPTDPNDKYYDGLYFIKGKLKDNDGTWERADEIKYYVPDDGKNILIRECLSGCSDKQELITGVEALKFQYSSDLQNWKNTNADRKSAQYIKAVFVLKDGTRLSPVRRTSFRVLDDDGSGTHLDLAVPSGSEEHLYERHEIVIPIPNNGLFP
jgi:type II secretory pathway pseudopilin PulG